jgi:hypothetical protein
VAKANAILYESARFNIGPVRRTLNTPTFALLVLHPGNQHRFSFQRAGRKSIDGTEAVQIAFAERLRPTLVAGAGGGDLAAQGSLWIDAERGTVLRTEIAFESEPADRARRTLTRIVTEYGPEPRLQLTVPVRMSETYEWGARNPDSQYAIKAVARYSGYRRFEVSTDETYRGTPEDRR